MTQPSRRSIFRVQAFSYNCIADCFIDPIPMAGEEPPAVPPRNSTVVPMEESAPQVREFFENRLQKVHDSLERRITECHTAVERITCNISPYIQMDSSQASSNSEVRRLGFKHSLAEAADRTAGASQGPVVAAGAQSGEDVPGISRGSSRGG